MSRSQFQSVRLYTSKVLEIPFSILSLIKAMPFEVVIISVMPKFLKVFKTEILESYTVAHFWVEVIYFLYSNSAVEVVFKFMKLFKIPYLKPIFKPIFFGLEWLPFMASFKQLSLNCVFEMAEWESILASGLNCLYMSIMHM